MNVPYLHCEGADLIGRTDSGYWISCQAIAFTISGTTTLRSYRHLESARGRLQKAHFTTSGSEGVEADIYFAHAYTGCGDLIVADVAFHGEIAS